MRRLQNIYRLGVKELISLRHDPALLVLIFFGFTVMVFVPATRGVLELRNATVAVVDEDGSALSRRLVEVLPQPYFKPPAMIAAADIDTALDAGRYSFIIDIPPEFQADVLAGRQPSVQVNIDATAMSQAGIGAGYLSQILGEAVEEYVRGFREPSRPAVSLTVRVKFNPNLQDSWFMGVMMIINVINLLAIITTGSALIRERERGTIDHLLAMPITPLEIMCAKIWSNGLVVVLAVVFSLSFVVRGILQVPLQGSLGLFVAATALYLFAATAIGIFLGTLANSMPQLGLLCILVVFPISSLSGNTTPLDSMPEAIQNIMLFSPSTHFVLIAQAILYRGAGFSLVWQEFLIVALIGLVFFLFALARFRRMVARQHA